jgi:adenine-specific DNA methylase
MNKLNLPFPIDNSRTPAAYDAAAEAWRPINYLGSKLRLVEPLKLAIDQMDPRRGRCVDLFAGSGTLSAALATSRDVTAVDIQDYSRVLCSAVLNPAAVGDDDVAAFDEAVAAQVRDNIECVRPLIDYETACLAEAGRGEVEPVCELIEHASMVAFAVAQPKVRPSFRAAHARADALVKADAANRLMTRFYGGLFFSYRQAAELDALLAVAHRLVESRRDVFLAAIISTASDIVNTVGRHFAQPIKPRDSAGHPKTHLIAKILRDRQAEVLPLFAGWLARYRSLPRSGRPHRVMRADYADALSSLDDIGVVYADPPYTRDHYSRFYHVLETMCLWDEPVVSTTRIRSEAEVYSRGMYRADRHQSPFCIKSQAPDAFARMFAGVKALGAPLVLSYSPYAKGEAHPRVMGIDQITDLARAHFKSVEVISAGRFSHVKLNATKLHLDASAEAELIFLCS